MHYQTQVRTDTDYADIPQGAAYSIDLEKAQTIIRLSNLVKANNLHCVEQFDYAVDWDWGDNDGRTEAETLVVFSNEFCFAALVKHTNVDIRTERRPIADLAEHYGLPGLIKADEVEPDASPSTHTDQALNEPEAPALALQNPEESSSDYVLRDDAPSCWITVGSISVHVRRNTDTGDEGVIVDLFPRGAEDDSMDSAYAFYQDAEEDLCTYHGIDSDDVAEWVGLHYRRNFEAEPAAARYDWIKRYLESHKGNEDEQSA